MLCSTVVLIMPHYESKSMPSQHESLFGDRQITKSISVSVSILICPLFQFFGYIPDLLSRYSFSLLSAPITLAMACTIEDISTITIYMIFKFSFYCKK